MDSEAISQRFSDLSWRTRSISSDEYSALSNYSASDAPIGLGIVEVSQWSDSNASSKTDSAIDVDSGEDSETEYKLENSVEGWETASEEENPLKLGIMRHWEAQPNHRHHDSGVDAGVAETNAVEIQDEQENPYGTYSCFDEDEKEEELEAFDNTETQQERLQRWTQFFDSVPLMRCIETGYDEYIQDLIYDRLMDEVQVPLGTYHRSELESSTFWTGVRVGLGNTSPDLDSLMAVEACKPTGRSMKLGKPAGRSDGKDPELIDLREKLMQKIVPSGRKLDRVKTI